ncbi:MAG: MotA/TolQ/ExbB proton channel family protein [Opitutales bacterium]
MERLLKQHATIVALAAISFVLPLPASAQSLEQIATQREAKLEDALERLRELRTKIEKEQVPLARKLNQKEARARELADELDHVRRLRDNSDVELKTQRSEVEARESQVDSFKRTLLPDAIADFDAALTAAERHSVGEGIRKYNLFLEDSEASEEEKLERGLTQMKRSLELVQDRLGGQRLKGQAHLPEGSLRKGSFIQLGPLLYFSANDGNVSGLVEERESLRARVFPLQTSKADTIAELAATGIGVLPIDPTLGDSLEVEKTRDTLQEHMAKGGIWIYPILFFALVATVVAVVKLFQVFSVRHPKPMVIHEIVRALREGDGKEARALAAAQPQPARDMLLAGVEHADESTEMVEEVMYESMLGAQPKLERFINVISVTAATAPLLGLLGTVTGIIKTFRLMTVFGAGDPKPLISGISEALITTEMGLVLAIPALIIHALLSRKVAGIMAQLEKSAVAFVNALARTAT